MYIMELLPFGSLAFWFFLAVGSIIMMVLVNTEKIGAATWTLLGLLGILQLGGCPIWQSAWARPQLIAIWAAGYVGVGVVWAFVKWFLFVNGERTRYEEVKASLIEGHGLEFFNSANGKKMLTDTIRWESIQFRPNAGRDGNVDRICGWIGYWPLSMVFTLVNDPVRKIARLAYKGISASLQNISDRAFAGTEKDLPGAE